MDERTFAQIAEAARVRPGDTLVVRMNSDCNPDEAMESRDLLKQALPGVDVVVIAGVEQLVVIEGGVKRD